MWTFNRDFTNFFEVCKWFKFSSGYVSLPLATGCKFDNFIGLTSYSALSLIGLQKKIVKIFVPGQFPVNFLSKKANKTRKNNRTFYSTDQISIPFKHILFKIALLSYNFVSNN